VQNDTKLEEAKGKIAGAQEVIKGLRDTGVTDDHVQQLNDFVTKYGGDDNASLADKFHFAAMKNLGVGPGAGEAHDLVNMFGSQGDRNLALYEGAQTDIKSAKYDISHAQKEKPTVDANAEIAKSDLEFARQKMEKNRADVQALQDKIAETDATTAIKQGGAKSDLGMRKASDALSDDRGIADSVKAGGNVSQADQQKLMADAARIAGHSVDLQTAAQIIENGANNMGIFMNQVAKLGAALEKVKPVDLSKIYQILEDYDHRISRAQGNADLH